MRDLQQALLGAGFDPQGTDGNYGPKTTQAVQAFQQARGLATTGIVDDSTWPVLMQEPAPSTDVRSLMLTAAFEGHGYTLVRGNWDGAWLTWGIIGFTMKYGEVQKIILKVQASAPQLIDQAFGAQRSELLQVMQSSRDEQEQWADSVSAGSRAIEPWNTAFAAFGQFPNVQQAQRDMAHDDYFVPAVNTAKGLNLASELGMALCFDIHVQNGGIGAAARALIQNSIAQQPPPDERALREVVANAVADAAHSQNEDVRQRKLCLANGEGEVHGSAYVLENWGLSEAPAPELT